MYIRKFCLYFGLSLTALVPLFSQQTVLPESLFPNQELYDLELLLERANNLEQTVNFTPASVTNIWSVQDVIDMAVANNLELAQSKKDFDVAQASYTGSIQDLYVPALKVGASVTARDLFTTSKKPADIAATSEGFTVDVGIPSISLSRRLFAGFANVYNFRISKENYLNAANTYSNLMRSTVYNAVKRYYEQFLREEEVRVALERLKQLQEQLRSAEINFRNGRVSDYDVILTRAQYYSAQPTFFNAERLRLYAREDFYRFLGYLPDNNVRIELKGDLYQITNVRFSEFDENESLAYIFSNDTELATLRTALANSKSTKGLKNAQRMPSLDISFDYTPSWGRDVAVANFSESAYNGSYGVTASLSVPILEWIPGTGIASQVKAAQEEIKKAEFKLLDAEEKKLIDIKNTLLNIRELNQSVAALRISTEQANVAARIAQVQYRNGRVSILDLNRAQVDYIEAKKKLLAAIYDELSARLNLQQSMNPLPMFLDEVKKIEALNQ